MASTHTQGTDNQSSTRTCSCSMVPPPASERRPIVISGPRAHDKFAIYESLVEIHDDRLIRPPCHTTRDPQYWEIDGFPHYFVSRFEFLNLLHADRFFQYQYFENNHYGTSMETVRRLQENGFASVFDTNLTGKSLLTKYQILDPRYVFMRPPNTDYLETRLRDRGMDEDKIQEEITSAEKEWDAAEASGLFDIVIINDGSEKAFRKLEAFALGL
ncbi:hypothetical protein FSST1_012418 [Fusarium sambucinum]